MEKGKEPKNVRSYRTVALTNLLCKIFKRMTNKRLVFYLEKGEKHITDSLALENKEAQ